MLARTLRSGCWYVGSFTEVVGRSKHHLCGAPGVRAYVGARHVCESLARLLWERKDGICELLSFTDRAQGLAGGGAAVYYRVSVHHD